jgi:hypothetical protein
MVSLSVVVGSVLFPDVFLWLLGPQYAGLHSELFVAICASSMGFLTSAVFSMNVARCWVYGWSTTANIAATLLVQISFIAAADLSRTATILLLGLITAAVQCLVHLSASIYGMRHADSQHARHA